MLNKGTETLESKTLVDAKLSHNGLSKNFSVTVKLATGEIFTLGCD